jgi:hypothetical protein
MSIKIEITASTAILILLVRIFALYLFQQPRTESVPEPPVTIKEERVEDEIEEITIPITDPDHPFFDPNSLTEPPEYMGPLDYVQIHFFRPPNTLLSHKHGLVVEAFLQQLGWSEEEAHTRAREVSDESYQKIRTLKSKTQVEVDDDLWEIDEEFLTRLSARHKGMVSVFKRMRIQEWYGAVPQMEQEAMDQNIGVHMGTITRYQHSRME